MTRRLERYQFIQVLYSKLKIKVLASGNVRPERHMPVENIHLQVLLLASLNTELNLLWSLCTKKSVVKEHKDVI